MEKILERYALGVNWLPTNGGPKWNDLFTYMYVFPQ